jgi:hypothetical protein
VGVGISPWVGCHGITEVLSSVSPFKKGWESLPYVRGGITLMHYSLFKFTVVWNTALPFWKLSVFESLLGISETFLCSISTLHLKTVLLQDVHQLLMLSAGTLMYLKQILFPLVIFYNNCGTIHILNTNYIQLYKFPNLVSCFLVFVLNFSSPFNQIDLI